MALRGALRRHLRPRAVVGREDLVVVLPGRRHLAGGTTKFPSTRRRSSSLPSRRSRSAAYALTSAVTKTVFAPTPRAAVTVSATTSPRRTSSAPPIRRREASRSTSDSCEERAPVSRGAVACGADSVVEDEQRQHRLGRLDGCGERRVVVEAEVAGEEDECDLHDARPRAGLGGHLISAATPCIPVSRGTTSSRLSCAQYGDVGLELGSVVDQVAPAAGSAKRFLSRRIGRRQADRRLGRVAALAMERCGDAAGDVAVIEGERPFHAGAEDGDVVAVRAGRVGDRRQVEQRRDQHTLAALGGCHDRPRPVRRRHRERRRARLEVLAG